MGSPPEDPSKEWARRLRRALPARRDVLPRSLAAFYDFVPDQDLIPTRARAAVLSAADVRRAARSLGTGAPAPEDRLFLAFADVCAGRFVSALARLRGLTGTDYGAALLEGAAWWLRCDRARSRRWLPQAMAAAERAVRLGAGRREAVLLRAQVRLEFEDNVGGVRDLDLLLARDGGDLNARIGKAETLADMLKYRPALREYALILRRRPGAWWALAQRGRLSGVCGYPGPALKDLDAALRRRPGSGPVRSWRGEVLRKLGRLPEALRELDRAIALEPDYAFSWECRGRLRLASGDARRALADLDRACRMDPALKLAFVWRGEAAVKLGRPARAWADFDRVFPLSPATCWNPPSDAPRGREERRAAMRSDLEALARSRPADPFARGLLGRFLAQEGFPREALEELTRALGACGRADARARARLLAWRGWAALRLGAPERARRDLDAARRADPAYALARDWSAP